MCCFTLLKAVLNGKSKEDSSYSRKRRSSRERRSTIEQLKVCCPYAILDVPQEANMSDIKQARNKKLKMHHPDKLTYASNRVRKNSEELSKMINRAYEELSEKRMRA